MITNNEHSNSTTEHGFVRNLKPDYKQSKEDVWASIFEEKTKEDAAPAKVPKIVSMSWVKYAAAASIALIVGLGLFCKLYTTSVYSNSGEHLTHVLPDGSTATLNAESSISYHPYWWGISRELSFEGEAFYEVKKGSNFAVVSQNGVTEVLGTSFNISTRYNEYSVFCATGKVRVINPTSKIEVVITPNMQANLLTDLDFQIIENVKGNLLTWRDNKFMFTAAPLNRVIQEVERQYGVEIVNEINLSNRMKYTGYFSKSQSVEETLKLICQSFGVNFVKQSNNKYVVSQKQ